MLRVLALQTSHTVEHGRGVNRVYCVRSSEWSTFHLHLCIIIPMYPRLTTFTKTSPKCHFTYIFCYFYFTLGLHPWFCWLLERSQILGFPRQLQTCARLMQGWVASAGCPPPKQKILATPVINTVVCYNKNIHKQVNMHSLTNMG